jgi:RNA polymerase sigma factor (sigma-70 family)
MVHEATAGPFDRVKGALASQFHDKEIAMTARSSAVRHARKAGNAALCSEGVRFRVDVNGSAPNEFAEEIYDAIRASLASRRLQEADRQDCAQETWLAILGSRMSGFRGGDLRAWVAVLARNKAIDTMRRTHRRPVLPLHEDVHVGARGTSNADEARQCIWSALLELEPTVHPRSFLVFCMHWFEGWSFGEIEDTLSLSSGQARLQSHRIKRKLRAMLEVAAHSSRAGRAAVKNAGSV